MSTVHPIGPPGVPQQCRGQRVEFARLEWWLGQPGDPAVLLEDFCAAVGLPARDLSRPGRHDGADTLCGVALLISAAAGAAMIGGAVGKPSPVPAVPDVVAVAYRHGHHGEAPLATKDTGIRDNWRSSWTSRDHASAVEAIRRAIKRGDVYQVNVVGHEYAAHDGDVRGWLSRLADRPQATYGGVLAGHDWVVASASPECLAIVDDSRLVTKPIKGTAPATSAGAQELRASVKERAEHVMIVDLERNDLAHVAVPGSVTVEELFALRRWGGLWQAESRVAARLRAGSGLSDVLPALCPPGSVTGVPKLAALEQIASLEPVGRGPAMGALGYLTAERLSLGLTIRTVAADARQVHLWAGGGITWRSDPDAEVAEARAKAAPVKDFLAGTRTFLRLVDRYIDTEVFGSYVPPRRSPYSQTTNAGGS